MKQITFWGLLFVLLIGSVERGFTEEPATWQVQLAIAEPGEGEEPVIPPKLQKAMPSLLKLAAQLNIRQYHILKEMEVSLSESPTQVALDDSLQFHFVSQPIEDHLVVEAAWARKQIQDGETTYVQIGGKVRKPFIPGQSLVILGPPLPTGIAMAVLHLSAEE